MPAETETLSGILKDIAADVQHKAAARSAGLRADFAIRMAAAYRNAPKHALAAILAALQAELEQALTAAADEAAQELQGRQATAVMAKADKPQRSDAGLETDEEGAPARPEAPAFGLRQSLMV